MAGPWTGEFSFLGNDPNINEELRRRIALTMLSSGKNRGFPKNVGEGLSAIGDAIGNRGIMSRLAAEEAASEKAGSDAVSRLSGPLAYAPTGDVPADQPAPVPPATPSEPPTPLFTAPEQPASMLSPNLPTTLGGASAGGVGPESMYTSPKLLGMPAPAAARQATPAGFRPPPAYLAAALERLVPDPERRAYLGHLAGKEAQSPGEVSPTGAAGPFQFTRGTGAQYGIPGDKRFDVDASIGAVNRFTDDNAAVLEKALGRPPTPSELALAHQQGAGTAARMLSGTGNAPARNLAVNNVPAGLSPQASAQRVMSYYGMPGGTDPRGAVSAQLVAQGQDPAPQPGQQATLGSPILPQGLSAAPPQQAIRAMPAPQQPVRVAQAGPPQAGYVPTLGPAPTPPPTTTPTLQRIQQEIQNTPPANRPAVQRALAPYIQQEQAKLAQQGVIYQDELKARHERAKQIEDAKISAFERANKERVTINDKILIPNPRGKPGDPWIDVTPAKAPQPPGSPPLPAKPLTEAESKSQKFLSAMILGEQQLKGKEKLLATSPGQAILNRFGGNSLMDRNYKIARGAADFSVAANLRDVSGAVIQESEEVRQYKMNMPELGDSDKVIEAKRERRKAIMDSMYGGLGEGGRAIVDHAKAELFKKHEEEQAKANEVMNRRHPGAQKGFVATGKTGSKRVFDGKNWLEYYE